MCENNIVAFGMNTLELLLTIGTVGSIITLGVVMVAYLNGHFANSKE